MVRIAALVLLGGLAGACARVEPAATGTAYDPYEAQNRQVHAFNKGVDRALFRPASTVYGRGLPGPVREGVSNFAANLSAPGDIVNDVLQGEAEDAGSNFFRFLINSTLGVAGVFDPATSIGLPARESDFGQTLAVWGAGEGAYLELPLLGPSTQRDAVGTAVDFALNPMRYALPDELRTPAVAARVGSGLQQRYVLRDTLDQVLYESADSYAQTREIYLQNRRFELGGDEAQDYFNPYDDVFDE
ncbi:VacJ family lipoprotein [Rhodobacteraceae bacterium MCCB 386]|nr:VacJ family lipoprotein [Roseitranquillus sediminis]